MMSSSIFFFILLVAFSGISGFHIGQVDVPDVVRNGTGPVNLSCIYDLGEDEDGLVIKWYHNENELIYQWIPPNVPQDIGIIAGLAEYPDEILRNPKSRSTIRLREVTLEMGGNYTCVVSTFLFEVVRTKSMIVYVPVSNASISTPAINDTHINLVCEVWGAWPRPVFEFRVGGSPIESRSKIQPNTDESYEMSNGFQLRHEAIVEEPEMPVLLECGISIPGTDYRRRESVVYYPREFLSELAIAFQKNNSSSPSLIANSPRIVVFALLLSYFFLPSFYSTNPYLIE